MNKSISTTTSKSYSEKFLDDFLILLQSIDLQAVERIISQFRNARLRKATIYIAGNGGSAATASHWVNDLGKGTKSASSTPFRVQSLSDNVSWLTAIANDEDYKNVFSGQLENFADEDDILVVISASGNSPNLLEVVSKAKTYGVWTIALLGFDGGALKQMVDDYILLSTPLRAYGLVESGHSFICHLISACLMEPQDQPGK